MWLRDQFDKREITLNYYSDGNYSAYRIAKYFYMPWRLIIPILCYTPLILILVLIGKLLNPISMMVPLFPQLLFVLFILGYFVPIKFIHKPTRLIFKGFLYWLSHPIYTMVIIIDIIVCGIPTLIGRAIKR